MTFSIVIPTYNGEAYVEAALQSALAQTRPADEIIVSDDHSTDRTLQLCRKYAGRVRICSHADGPSGFVNAWNRAIAHATGDYIAILHQDDLLAPAFLAEAERALTAHPEVRHLFVPCNYIDADGAVLSEPDYCDGQVHRYSGRAYVAAYRQTGHPHIHRCPGVLTHRDVFRVCRYRAEAGHIADDDFFYRVGQYTDVIGILRPLASYRLHGQSETGHLDSQKMVTRLAHDYLFQLAHFQENPLFGSQDWRHFTHYARRFAFQQFVWAVRSDNAQAVAEAAEQLARLQAMGVSPTFKMRLFCLLTRCAGWPVARALSRLAGWQRRLVAV